jgi:hypothetical protein
MIGDVMRRLAFVGLLLYVTLDLSVSEMPGAFVFEPAETVESAQTSRLRAAGESVPLAAPFGETLASTPAVDVRHVARPTSPVREPVTVPAAARPPRATLASPSSSEDPL